MTKYFKISSLPQDEKVKQRYVDIANKAVKEFEDEVKNSEDTYMGISYGSIRIDDKSSSSVDVIVEYKNASPALDKAISLLMKKLNNTKDKFGTVTWYRLKPKAESENKMSRLDEILGRVDEGLGLQGYHSFGMEGGWNKGMAAALDATDKANKTRKEVVEENKDKLKKVLYDFINEFVKQYYPEAFKTPGIGCTRFHINSKGYPFVDFGGDEWWRNGCHWMDKFVYAKQFTEYWEKNAKTLKEKIEKEVPPLTIGAEHYQRPDTSIGGGTITFEFNRISVNTLFKKKVRGKRESSTRLDTILSRVNESGEKDASKNFWPNFKKSWNETQSFADHYLGYADYTTNFSKEDQKAISDFVKSVDKLRELKTIEKLIEKENSNTATQAGKKVLEK